ncbi:hypothetical protein BDQ17DRAFT_1320845 [Cyathus striatus]|nr:hypothetical protein BDQ17DRAFT_1320845 [Cyathus striatus]
MHKHKKTSTFWEDTVAAVDDEEEEQAEDMGFFDRRYGASTHRRSSWGSDAEEPISPVSVAATSSLPHSSFSHAYRHAPEEQEKNTLAPTAPAVSSAGGDWTPTCGQSLRRQWQAFALRFRFGVFRAQRRVKRRVHSLL